MARTRKGPFGLGALLLAAVALWIPPTTLQAFSDTQGHWAAADIESLRSAGILDEAERFSPDDPITRLDFAVYTARALGLAPSSDAIAFADAGAIPEDRRPWVAAAAKGGLLQGYPDGTLRPLHTITRAELATIFGRALTGLGAEPERRYFDLFADGDRIPEWATPAAVAVQEQIVLGRPAGSRPLFAPDDRTTRAEAVTMIRRFTEVREAHRRPLPEPGGPAPALTPDRVGEVPVSAAFFMREPIALERLREHGEQLNLLIYADYRFDAEGRLVGRPFPEASEWAREADKPLLAMLGNHDPAVITRLLNDPAVRGQALAALPPFLEAEGFAGVNIDFEGVPVTDRDAYVEFVRLVAELLRPRGYWVTVSVPARTAAIAATSWGGAYDYAGLGRHADLVLPMTYDQHHTGGPAGPIGAVDWAAEVLRYALERIPAERVLLGIPAYGRDWPEGAAGSTVRAWEAPGLAAAHGVEPALDQGTGEAGFSYVDQEGRRHQVFYTPPEGLRLKLELVERLGLGGFGMWRLGQEADGYWEAIADREAWWGRGAGR